MSGLDTDHLDGDLLDADHLDEGHLDEVALEALATGRDDLVSEALLDHLDECELCAARVAEEQRSAEDASLGLMRAMPALDDLDAMIARAMEHAPDGADEVLASPAPSGRSLWIGAGVGGVIAAALAVLSAPGAESLSGLGSIGGLSSIGGQALTLVRAADRVVDSTMPGGWLGVALGGLLVALLLAVPARLLLRDGAGRGASMLTGTMAALLLSLVSLPSTTAHAYRVDGAWPDPRPAVEVDVDRQPTSEALRQAAASAGLGVVVQLEDDPLVTLHVHGAPIDEVVEALLGERDVVVRPGRSLITVRPDDGATEASAEPTAEPNENEAAAPPAAAPEESPASETPAAADLAPSAPVVAEAPAPPPVPSAPPSPPPALAVGAASNAALGDMVTLGDDATVAAEQHVRGVYTMGGNARVDGHAYGDVVTMGGDATIDGEVVGNVTTMGGDIALGPEARVHGDLNAMGGEVEVHETAVLYGRILGAGGHGHDRGEREGTDDAGRGPEGSPGFFRWGLWNALLFLFGLVMLGANRERFSTLRGELAARPVRSAFGGLFGFLAGSALAVAFTLTVIGIPGAMVLSVLLAAGYLVGWGTSAWWLGSVLPLPFLNERPVAQLGVGVAVLFLIGLVPKLGTLLVTLAALAGLGAVIATSFGANPRRPKKRPHVPTGPFR